MKNSAIFCLVFSILLCVGLACKNNPLAKFTKQYKCEIAGESEPQTSEEYLKRAGRHLADKGYSAEFDECAFRTAVKFPRLPTLTATAKWNLRCGISITKATAVQFLK